MVFYSNKSYFIVTEFIGAMISCWSILLLCFPFIAAATCFEVNPTYDPQTYFTVQSTTFIDVLNGDPDYESLLKLLQRTRLIPTINRLNASIFFAPTNNAISQEPLWVLALSDSYTMKDNIEETLRQQLLYHLINCSIPSLPETENPQVHKTLLFPNKVIDPPSREPPPGPPWMPVPGGTLGGQPQRLRVSSKAGLINVGVDAFGEGGIKVVKGKLDASNGILLGIDKIVEVPPDLATVVSRQPSLTYVSSLMSPAIIEILRNASELTLFLPVDSSWDSMNYIERLYLESEFSTKDVLDIIDMHAVGIGGVHWSESFKSSTNVTTRYGTTLEIKPSSDKHKVFISDAELINPDIYASNGVIHTISSLLIPPGVLHLTPEKYLLALNCTSFVSLIHSVDLVTLINSIDSQYTILAPNDDVLELFGKGEDELPEKGSESLKRLLQYHFIPGKWTPDKLKNGILIETALEENGLDGGRQVIAVEVNAGNGKHKDDRTIRFGDISVLGEHVEANNTIIYFLSRPLSLPSDVLTTALPSLQFSSFLAAIFSTTLADRLKTEPRTTFLLPNNEAFKRVGVLVSAHLLAATSKTDLEHVLLHHAIKGVEYATSLRNGSQQSFPTLDGSDLPVHRLKNGSVILSSSGGWAGMQGNVITHNMLTQTGVIHEISDLLLPRSLNLTAVKLMKAAKGNTMISLIMRGGLDWVLTGSPPPDDSPWARDEYAGVGWTILCPTDEAFKDINMTQLFEDQAGLASLIHQHLIPTPPSAIPLVDDEKQNSMPLIMDDSATYSTAESRSSAYGDVVFRLVEDKQDGKSDQILIGIKNSRGTAGKGDWARVLAWGRSTIGGGIGGVIQIDQLLVPYHPPLWLEYGPPVAFGVIGVGFILLFFLAVRCIWRRDTTEATYEPVGGFDDDS